MTPNGIAAEVRVEAPGYSAGVWDLSPAGEVQLTVQDGDARLTIGDAEKVYGFLGEAIQQAREVEAHRCRDGST